MRRNDKPHPSQSKRLARQKYAERQIDKWCKWSWDVRGKIKYKELVELQDNIILKHMEENKNWSLSIGTYPGVLLGARTYEEETQITHVLYLPFVDIALEIFK